LTGSRSITLRKEIPQMKSNFTSAQSSHTRVVTTRRQFIAGLSGLLGAASVSAIGLSACGTAAPAGSAGAAPTAASSGAVVALDEFAGLSVLALGIKPATIFLIFGYVSAKAIFDAANIKTVAAPADGVNLEAVAAVKPTRIIGVSVPTTAMVQDKLNVIAPTTVVEYTASWQDQLKVTGTALDRSDTANNLISRIEREIGALKTALETAGKAGQTVSVIGAVGIDAFALSRTGLIGSILSQLGMKRPAVQDVETEATDPFLPISPEKISDHDADIIFLLSGDGYQSDVLTGSALWPKLSAVQNKQVKNVTAEIWFASTVFGADWIIQDIRATLVNGTPAASSADVLNRWQTFSATK
jgi:iron complex transport system substrate-binding protein